MSMQNRAAWLTLAAGGAMVLAAPAGAEVIYGLSTRNQLVTFDSASANTLTTARFISGLANGEEIIGIDFRPATGQLYGLGSLNRLYTLDPSTGAASLVGSGFSPQLNGVEFGFDFNPSVDRIRMVSDLDQNLRLNPITGGLTAIDGNLAYLAGDPAFGENPNITGVAYTNNVPNAQTTVLYGIDSARDSLVRIDNPNAGGLVTVGNLGFDITGLVGFDISGVTGFAYVAAQDAGGQVSRLYRINLANGTVSGAETIGLNTGPLLIRDITVTPVPAPGAFALVGLAGLAACRRRR